MLKGFFCGWSAGHSDGAHGRPRAPILCGIDADEAYTDGYKTGYGRGCEQRDWEAGRHALRGREDGERKSDKESKR